MDSVLRFLRKLLILVRREKFSGELAEEMAFHLEQVENDLREDGIDPREARHAARRRFGNAAQLGEQSLEKVGFGFEAFLQDLRFAVRQLRKGLGFASTAILLLAVGIGASTAIFSAVNSVLFQPLPYPDGGRITSIWDFGNQGSRLYVTFGTYRELLQRSRSFDALAVMKPWQPTFTGPTQPERISGQRVGAGYFRVLGIRPRLGRDFQDADDQLDGPRVAILSDGLWRRNFAADPAIIGRQVKLDANFYTVVGVMPRAFQSLLAPSAELWAPLQYDKALLPDNREWGHHLQMIARLRPGVGIDQARRELDSIARTPLKEFPRPAHASLSEGLIVTSLQSDVTTGARPALLAILGAVLLLLMIACVNVINLMLARGAQRRAEFALRAALGAGRPRLVRQLVTESALLATCGALLGIVVAHIGVRILVAVSPAELPRAGTIRLDATAFAFAFAVTALVALVIGLVPALYASRVHLHSALQQGSQRLAGGHEWARRALVISEVALAVVLLVSAGLLFRSLQHLFAIDPGFDASHLLTMQVQTSGLGADKAATDQFFIRALAAVRSVPGVAAAAFTSQLPLSGELDGYGVHFESSPTGKPEADNGGWRYAVSPGYFETMGIPLRLGRRLDAHDVPGAPFAVLISESLARGKFPGHDPVGQRLRIGPNEGPWYTIVGIVGNVKQASLADSQLDAVYITNTQWHLFDDKTQWLVVRASVDPSSLTPAIKAAIWSVNKNQPIVRVATLEALVARSGADRHFALSLLEAFALVALVLAAAGIYGILSGSVSERTREIGVRSALGASRHDILALIVGQGMTLTGVGVLIGLVGAAAASRALVTLLFGVSRLDPATYVAVVILLLCVSAAACWAPARRAAHVDPSVTLRAE